jgi:hypothetical protein
VLEVRLCGARLGFRRFRRGDRLRQRVVRYREVRPRVREPRLVVRGVDAHERLAGAHLLILVDEHLHHLPGDARRDVDEVPLHERVVGRLGAPDRAQRVRAIGQRGD